MTDSIRTAADRLWRAAESKEPCAPVRDLIGELEIGECDLAASQFMELSKASLFLPFVFQAAPAPSEQRMTEVVESATRMFLAAYRAR